MYLCTAHSVLEFSIAHIYMCGRNNAQASARAVPSTENAGNLCVVCQPLARSYHAHAHTHKTPRHRHLRTQCTNTILNVCVCEARPHRSRIDCVILYYRQAETGQRRLRPAHTPRTRTTGAHLTHARSAPRNKCIHFLLSSSSRARAHASRRSLLCVSRWVRGRQQIECVCVCNGRAGDQEWGGGRRSSA